MAGVTGKGAPRQRRAKAEASPTTPDPIEIAMEAEASGRAPVGPAAEVLRRHGDLIAWQARNERIGFVLRLLTGFVGVTAAVAVLAMAWNARQADGLLVEPLLVPQSIVDQGLSGAVLARRALDRMATLDEQTGYFRAVHVSGNWSQSAAIPIPRTGLTVDDVDRSLRRWLGRQTIVTGEVFSVKDVATVLLRTDAGRAVSRSGPADQVAALTQEAAEALFAQVRPLQYGYGIARRGDLDGGRRYAEAALRKATTGSDKCLALSGIGLTYLQQGLLKEAIASYGEAIRVGPPGYRPYLAYGYSLYNAGRSEEAVGSFAAAAEAPPRPGGAAASEAQFRAVAAMTQELRVGAFQDALQTGGDLFETQIRGYFSPDLRPEKVEILLGLHRVSDASAVTAHLFETSQDADRRERFRTMARARIAAASEDWAAVLAETEDVAAPANLPGSGNVTRILRAVALAHVGRADEARVLVATLPRDCDYCLQAYALAAERRGDRGAADRDWAEAVRLTPSIPFANLDWGRALLGRGDAAGAIHRFKAAHGQQPRFADPLAYWGEALLAQGDARAAAVKFAEAAKLAPRWGRLHLKWGEALAKLGKADEARTKWRAAATMDLSPADRAALKAHGV